MESSVPDLERLGITKAPEDLAHKFRCEIADLLRRENLSFPGAQPVSFARRHLSDLRKRDYYLCEKSDGIRCLLYCTEDEEGREIHYLIDRKNDYYWVPYDRLHFPLPIEARKDPGDLASFHIKTLLDGELLWDTYADGRRELKYLVFDCLFVDGLNMMERTLDKRLAYFIEKIHKPLLELRRKFPQDAENLIAKVEKKHFEFAYGAETVFKEIVPKLNHGSDGLVFTCRSTPYVSGTDEHILKWKPAEENTVDFRLSLEFPPLKEDKIAELGPDEPIWDADYDAVPECILYVFYGSKQGYRPLDRMFLTSSEWAKMKQYAIERNDGLECQIVECHQDSQQRWRFNRFREDKDEANFHTVVKKVMESIEDGVSRDELVSSAKDVRTAWKERHAKEEEEARKMKEKMAQKHAANTQAQEQMRMKRKAEEEASGSEKKAKTSEDSPEQGKRKMRDSSESLTAKDKSERGGDDGDEEEDGDEGTNKTPT